MSAPRSRERLEFQLKAMLAQVEKAVANSDNEVAHSARDQYWRSVLKMIAGGGKLMSAVELAEWALKTESLKFEEWCA